MSLDLEPPRLRAPNSSAASLAVRPRRLRRTPALRALVRETRLHPAMLVAPLFVRPGVDMREPIASMPGQDRLSPDLAAEEAARLAELGVGGVILFGLPESKDADGSGASDDDGIVQDAFGRIRALELPLVTIADTCLCEYTDHGHCGPLAADGSVDNDAALGRLSRSLPPARRSMSCSPRGSKSSRNDWRSCPFQAWSRMARCWRQRSSSKSRCARSSVGSRRSR